jgi:hypothetical protein
MPPAYATELQTVINTLNDLKQPQVSWDCGTTGIGVLASDSMMFQRGEPTPSDPHLGNFYGLAMPLVKHGIPVAPVQLETVTVPHALDGMRVLFLSYDGQKPLSPEVHTPLAKWVKAGGVLVVCDKDADPYLQVRDWWNSDGKKYATPRQHLFEQLGLTDDIATDQFNHVGKGGVIWLRERPVKFSTSAADADRLVATAKLAAQSAGLEWREKNYLLLQRGPYVIASGMDESIEGAPRELSGRFVNLFDAALTVQTNIVITPGSRQFCLDLDKAQTGKTHLLASACKAVMKEQTSAHISFNVEGVAHTPAIVLVETAQAPRSVILDGNKLETFEYSAKEHLLWIHFENVSAPRILAVNF